MCRVLKLEIKETQAELQELLRQQKTGYGKERIQALYLLKTRQVETVQHLAVVLGRGRMTVQRWLKLYREGGLSTLLELRKSPGRPKTISLEVRSLIKKELSEPEGFKSYEEIRTWLLASEGIEASYKVVHEVVRYKLKAKLKAPRPRSLKQNKGVEEDFKKNFHHG
ncbi:helix-turn-helix domain-containing protein [Scytonema sp. PRP1]|uniref:helix-turn-helix domain-containing protein n=1 Tax=Scytonema sp. PRP1 TaxID=3120513 RepID=UPI002FD11D54